MSKTNLRVISLTQLSRVVCGEGDETGCRACVLGICQRVVICHKYWILAFATTKSDDKIETKFKRKFRLWTMSRISMQRPVAQSQYAIYNVSLATGFANQYQNMYSHWVLVNGKWLRSALIVRVIGNWVYPRQWWHCRKLRRGWLICQNRLND